MEGDHRMELVLLLIVVVCVIALICINRKSKDLKNRDATAETCSEISTSTGEEQESKNNCSSSQNTIYKFLHKTGMRLCPFCDGENGTDAQKCGICGKDI